MGTVRPGEIVEAFPLGQFCLEIDVVLVSQQLIELFLIGTMGALDFAVELR